MLNLSRELENKISHSWDGEGWWVWSLSGRFEKGRVFYSISQIVFQCLWTKKVGMRKAKCPYAHGVKSNILGKWVFWNSVIWHVEIKCTASSAWLDLLEIQAALMMFCYCPLLFSSPIHLFMATFLAISLFCFETLKWNWVASGSTGVQALGSSVRSVSFCDFKSGHLPSFLEEAGVSDPGGLP